MGERGDGMSTVPIETMTERINTMMAYQAITDDTDRIAQMICDITAMRLNLVDRNQQIAELREKLRWIPVSERLPEHIKDVLCLGHFGGKTVASRSFKSDGWFVYDMDGKVIKLNIDEVKYWMEIPELGDGE
jgi:hypothetical protein